MNSPILVYVARIIRHIELILGVWDLTWAFEAADRVATLFIYR